jgi:orotate phosphoribosyltransferase
MGLMNKDDLARTIQDRCRLTGEFVLRSGQVSNVYFDKYQFEADPVLLKAVADLLAPLVPEGTELLAGLELGGVPVATALSLRSGMPQVLVRKQAKTYGTAKLAEGPDISGKRLLVVEDVITTGGQVVASTGDLRDLGAEVSTVLCVIDRRPDPTVADKLSAAGLNVISLFTAADLGGS